VKVNERKTHKMIIMYRHYKLCSPESSDQLFKINSNFNIDEKYVFYH